MQMLANLLAPLVIGKMENGERKVEAWKRTLFVALPGAHEAPEHGAGLVVFNDRLLTPQLSHLSSRFHSPS